MVIIYKEKENIFWIRKKRLADKRGLINDIILLVKVLKRYEFLFFLLIDLIYTNTYQSNDVQAIVECYTHK
jgi:hypothetical protein